MIIIMTEMGIMPVIGVKFAVMVIKADDGYLHYGDTWPIDNIIKGIDCCINYRKKRTDSGFFLLSLLSCVSPSFLLSTVYSFLSFISSDAPLELCSHLAFVNSAQTST